MAYFSVAIDHLSIGTETSKTMKRNLNGIFNEDRVPCYLIGQLARNDSCSRQLLSGEELLEYALDVLENAHDLVGGRFVRVDCKDRDSLLKFYQNNGFRSLPGRGRHGLCRLVRFISK